MTRQGQSIVDGTRPQGKSAQRANIMAANIIAETVKSTLGPKGMDKVLITQENNVVITNDGVTILEEMAVDHPIAKMIVEVAQSQEEEVGDGTTTAVILASELLNNAESLLDKKIHPTVIIQGYKAAIEHAITYLEEIATPAKNDVSLYKAVAQTAMTGKSAEYTKELLADLCVRAIQVIDTTKAPLSAQSVRVYTQAGGSVTDSEIIEGIVVEKPIVHPDMPTLVKNAKVALLTCPLEIQDTETKANIQITNPSQIQAFLENEEHMLKAMVDKLVSLGVTAVFCQKGISEIAQHFLAKHGIIACRRMRNTDLKSLATATGATIINALDDMTAKNIGVANEVSSLIVNGEQYTRITQKEKQTQVSLMIHASTVHVAQELQRAVEDALGDLRAVVRAQKVVGGAGAVEIALSRKLMQISQEYKGKEQLAVEAAAKSLEVIPQIIAENAGLDPIDVLTKLYAYQKEHSSVFGGIDAITGDVVDTLKAGIIEPILVKKQALLAASEVATMILRIDDIIFCGPMPEAPKPGQGQME